jgi:4-amino-4-deoxy-L-arabinose transferase-like glycosyltransferase
LAAFITLTSPSIFAFSRTLFMEIPLAAIVVLNFYLIIKTRQTPSLKNFIFLSLATSLGMLFNLYLYSYCRPFSFVTRQKKVN